MNWTERFDKVIPRFQQPENYEMVHSEWNTRELDSLKQELRDTIKEEGGLR